MPRNVHARNTPDGLRFRIWSSVTDSYHTRPMTEEEAKELLMDDYTGLEVKSGVAAKDLEERLARTKARGTSSHIHDPVDLNSPWEEEICPKGCHFHHEFKHRDSDGLCSGCGEPEDDIGHKPRCAVRCIECGRVHEGPCPE